MTRWQHVVAVLPTRSAWDAPKLRLLRLAKVDALLLPLALWQHFLELFLEVTWTLGP